MPVIKFNANMFAPVLIEGALIEGRVVYETRKVRATGSHTRVVDMRDYGHRFIAQCVTHGTQCEPLPRLVAEAKSHLVAEWCPACTGDMGPQTTKAKTAQSRPRTVVLDAMPDERRNFAGMMPAITWNAPEAPAKKTRSRRTKKATEKVAA